MNHKDSLIQREEERRRGQMTEQKSVMGSSSKPRGFRNHPDDPTTRTKFERGTYIKFGRYGSLDASWATQHGLALEDQSIGELRDERKQSGQAQSRAQNPDGLTYGAPLGSDNAGGLA
jgi:hypothetical protein